MENFSESRKAKRIINPFPLAAPLVRKPRPKYRKAGRFVKLGTDTRF
jgi:hypothetical protein